MTTKFAVETKDLTKKYGSFRAIDTMTLQLEPNKIYGLLGRNGAGKTTLLNVLSGRIFETSGEHYILGSPVYENIEILKQICYIEEKGFYAPSIKVYQVMELARGLYPNWDEEYAKELIALFELDPRKRYKQLSRGMESSLGLIIGLASRAPITIFDEPSLGLDAVIRERFYNTLIDDFTSHPRTIIVSTHLIDEVSSLFEDVIMIDNGKLLLQSDAMELKEKAFYISGKEDDVRAVAKDALILEESHFGNTLILSVFSDNGIVPSNAVEIQPIPLQKIFVHLINPDIQSLLKKGGIIK